MNKLSNPLKLLVGQFAVHDPLRFFRTLQVQLKVCIENITEYTNPSADSSSGEDTFCSFMHIVAQNWIPSLYQTFLPMMLISRIRLRSSVLRKSSLLSNSTLLGIGDRRCLNMVLLIL